jgi:hypothetical protein
MSTLDNSKETPQPSDVSPWPGGLRYGLITGLALVAISLLLSLTGVVDPTNQGKAGNWLASIFSYAIMITGMVIAVKNHRDNELGRFITFGRSFLVGFIVIIVASVLSLVYTYVYFTVIDPGMLEAILEASRDQMIEQRGLSEEDAENALAMTSFMFTPGMMALIGTLGSALFGAIFALIVAAIMKRNPPEAF